MAAVIALAVIMTVFAVTVYTGLSALQEEGSDLFD